MITCTIPVGVLLGTNFLYTIPQNPVENIKASDSVLVTLCIRLHDCDCKGLRFRLENVDEELHIEPSTHKRWHLLFSCFQRQR